MIKVRQHEHESIVHVKVSPDGSKIVSCGNQTIRVWNSSDLKLEATKQKAHANKITCVDFAPNNKTIVSGSHDTLIKFWYLVGASKINF